MTRHTRSGWAPKTEAHCECAQDGQWGCGRPRSEIHPPSALAVRNPAGSPRGLAGVDAPEGLVPDLGRPRPARGLRRRAARFDCRRLFARRWPTARTIRPCLHEQKHRRPEARSSPPAGRSSPPISVLGGGPSGPVVDRAPLARAVPSVANWARTRDAHVKIGRLGQMFCRQNISAD